MASLPAFHSFSCTAAAAAATEQGDIGPDHIRANETDSPEIVSNQIKAHSVLGAEGNGQVHTTEQAVDFQGNSRPALPQSSHPELPINNQPKEDNTTSTHSGKDDEISVKGRDTTLNALELQASKQSHAEVTDGTSGTQELPVSHSLGSVSSWSNSYIEPTKIEVSTTSDGVDEANGHNNSDSFSVQSSQLSPPPQTAVESSSAGIKQNSALVQSQVSQSSQSKDSKLTDGTAEIEDNRNLESTAGQPTKGPELTAEDWPTFDQFPAAPPCPKHGQCGWILDIRGHHISSRLELKELLERAQIPEDSEYATSMKAVLDKFLQYKKARQQTVSVTTDLSSDPNTTDSDSTEFYTTNCDSTDSDSTDSDSIDFDASDSDSDSDTSELEADLPNAKGSQGVTIMWIGTLLAVLTLLMPAVRAVIELDIGEDLGALDSTILLLSSIYSALMPIMPVLIGSAILLAPLAFVISAANLIIKNTKNKRNEVKNNPLTARSNKPTVHQLYVMGSGGHTTEMIAFAKLTFDSNKNCHRSYLITDGDQHSVSQIQVLEYLINQGSGKNAATGTWEPTIIMRARSVHQNYFTSVFTSIISAWQIWKAVISIPNKRAKSPKAELFRYPDVIITNGPGTGFIVALVAFALKTLCIAPRDRMKVVFLETWARSHDLGLTGKLFYLTKIADLFVVQTKELADKLNVPFIGNVNEEWAEMGNSILPEATKEAAEVDPVVMKAAKKAARKAKQKKAKRALLNKK